MIINKKFTELKGVVEFEIIVEDDNSSLFSDCNCDDDIELFEYERFSNLNELLLALSSDTLLKIKKEYSEIYGTTSLKVDEVKVTNIIFTCIGEGEKNQSRISVGTNGIYGWSTVEIDNEDVEHRLMVNLTQVKRIIDNTLEEYPIKYTKE